MTTTETIIANYGLVAVFLGGLLEGETILILAAVAANHGILSLPMVFVVGAIWYFVARAVRRRQGVDMEARFEEIPIE